MRKPLIILLIILVLLIPIISAGGYWEYLTKGLADTLYCKLTGCTMQGNIDMDGYNITNAGNITGTITEVDPVWASDKANYQLLLQNSSNITVANNQAYYNGSTNDNVDSTELDNLCNTDGKILKRVGGTWVCADDAVGASGSNFLNYTKDFDGVDKVTLSFTIPS